VRDSAFCLREGGGEKKPWPPTRERKKGRSDHKGPRGNFPSKREKKRGALGYGKRSESGTSNCNWGRSGQKCLQRMPQENTQQQENCWEKDFSKDRHDKITPARFLRMRGQRGKKLMLSSRKLEEIRTRLK